MMKLIMEQNSQIKQMESEMEKMIKEKEQIKKTSKVPLEAVPLGFIPATKPSTSSTVDGAKKLIKAV